MLSFSIICISVLTHVKTFEIAFVLRRRSQKGKENSEQHEKRVNDAKWGETVGSWSRCEAKVGANGPGLDILVASKKKSFCRTLFL